MIQINVRIFCVSNFSSYNLAIISISSFQSLRLCTRSIPRRRYRKISTWFAILFITTSVCVCVCVCHDSINTIIPYYIYTIHIYLWYDLIRSTLCVCVEFTKKSFERNAVRVYCSLRGLNFRVSTKCILYFSSVYFVPSLQKNILRQYTVREGRIFEIRIQSVTLPKLISRDSNLN